MQKLLKKIVINTRIEVLTGLHIGGSDDSVEIGGIDNPVIKIATKKGQPYIPGSSLKGKIRSLLEQIAGSAKVGGNERINNLFGYSADNLPSKIIVRDAYLDAISAEELEKNDLLDMPYTENKWENTIDRVRGIAEHPRQAERVPVGAKFNAQFILNIWKEGEEADLLGLLKKGMKALEADYLGGSGSRGYGQIKFLDFPELISDSEDKSYLDIENFKVGSTTISFADYFTETE